MTGKELVTVAEVAVRIRAKPETVRRWLRQGRLRGAQPGGRKLGYRIAGEELERFPPTSQRRPATWREDVTQKAAALVRDLAAGLAAGPTAEEVLAAACRALAQVLRADCVCVLLLRGGSLHAIPVGHGLSPQQCQALQSLAFPLDEYPCFREAVESQRPVFLSDAPGGPGLPPSCAPISPSR